MRHIISTLLLSLLPLHVSAEGLSVPQLMAGEAAGKTTVTTWAHAGKSVHVQATALQPGPVKVALYQVSGQSVAPLTYQGDQPQLEAGKNDLNLAMPAHSERGKVLFRLASSEGKLLGNLIVEILPADAWASIVKSSQQGAVFIDPALKKLSSWAQAQGIEAAASSSNNMHYTFSKTKPDPSDHLFKGVLVYERKAPAPLAIIEVINDTDLKTIILPPGYLDQLPDSAPAQALLLKHLKLLP
ncbi:hypothetical protein JO972_06110 [Verrucomicrobiaceae bacterium 5K15]|uniref:Uncharacterized protein n=1 Tax=Oceaniferula flava TaxID=2800421 RepID=A0AAE2SA07_9BACT|nr:hypothetical protein [Oceaniferula flavus]MBK1854523.1 hypothetical protein [Oceaniferula flavus]MBM1135829.1 hypothetical protein [Oceaniferula flavus]